MYRFVCVGALSEMRNAHGFEFDDSQLHHYLCLSSIGLLDVVVSVKRGGGYLVPYQRNARDFDDPHLRRYLWLLSIGLLEVVVSVKCAGVISYRMKLLYLVFSVCGMWPI